MLYLHGVWHVARLDLNNQRTSAWLLLESWHKCELRLFYIEFFGKEYYLHLDWWSPSSCDHEVKQEERKRRDWEGRKERALNKTYWKKEPLLQCCAEENISGATVNQSTLWYWISVVFAQVLVCITQRCSLCSRKIHGPTLSKLDSFVSVGSVRQANTPSFSHNSVFWGVWICLNRLVSVYKNCALGVIFSNSLTCL